MYTIRRTLAVDGWLSGVTDTTTRTRLAARLHKAVLGNLGDIIGIGCGVFEMREHFGPGWRMYCLILDSCTIVMLGGGEKSSQRRDIQQAYELARSIEP